MDGRSISKGREISKGLMRAVSVVFDEPVSEVEVGVVKVIKANFREGEPFILEGPVKTFQTGVVFRLAHAGKEMLDAEQATGPLKFTGEFATVVGMHEG